MTTLLNTLTQHVQIQDNIATIHYQDYNQEDLQTQTNRISFTINEETAVAKTIVINAVIQNEAIDELNQLGINSIDKAKQALTYDVNSKLTNELVQLIESLNQKEQLSSFKRFFYWLTSSQPVHHITSPEELYNKILKACYWQHLFIISTPKLIPLFKKHPNFKSKITPFEHIQLIGHINSNPIFCNNMINSNGIMSGAIPTSIYSSTTTPQYSTTIQDTSTKIQLQCQTVLHHIPQHLNKFYHFNATQMHKPFYKKLLKL